MYKVTGGDGREYGPITAEQVRQWIAEGRLNAGSPISAGGGEWKPLYQFPEFAQQVAGLAASPPPFGGSAPGAHYQATAPRTSGLAIAALITGFFGIVTCGVASLVGLILGIVSLSQIKKSNGQLKGSGLAIAGICVSGAFLLLLPALLLPALAGAKQRAQSVTCVIKARELGKEVRTYAQSNNGQFPPAATWSDAISNQVGTVTVFKCPSRSNQQCSYSFNTALSGKRIGQVNPQTVMLFESDSGWNSSGGMSSAVSHGHTQSSRNRERAIVVVHVDGSAQLVPESQMSFQRWQP